MFSDTGPPASLPTLAVITMGVMQAALAMPAMQDTTHKLVITSNIEPGITYEDALGPFIIGKYLMITCSTNNSKSLSWWEGNKQLPTVVAVENDTISCNFNVGNLQAKDSRRHFTCRELATGTEKSVDLKLTDVIMEIHKDGYPLQNNQTVKVFEGRTFNLKCIVNGSKPSTGTWWEGKTKLPSKRSTSPNTIHNQLALRPRRAQDNGRQLTCRARNGQLTKTVVLNVVEGVQGVIMSPATDAPTTAKSPTKTSSSTNTARRSGTTSTHVEGVTTSTSVEQGALVPGKPSSNMSVTTTSAKLLDSIDMILHDRRLIIAVFAPIAALMIVLIIVMLWLIIRVSQRDNSTTHQHSNPREHRSDSSRNCASAQTTQRSFDPPDQPSFSPLLPGPPGVEVGDEMDSSGGRMSVAMPDDRDHSYYYPDQINNSYYYPRLLINKLSSWAKSSH